MINNPLMRSQVVDLEVHFGQTDPLLLSMAIQPFSRSGVRFAEVMDQLKHELRPGFMPTLSELSRRIGRSVTDQTLQEIYRLTRDAATSHAAPEVSPHSSGHILEYINSARQAIDKFHAEERARRLTDAQLMQICWHFKLYSRDAIHDFIKEHQR